MPVGKSTDSNEFLDSCLSLYRGNYSFAGAKENYAFHMLRLLGVHMCSPHNVILFTVEAEGARNVSLDT